MKPLITQFFKYLEDTEGQKTPLKVKLLNPKEFKFTPEDLYVKGDLNLYSSPITSLPKGLKIEFSLNLIGTNITSLPKGLEVGRNIYLKYTPLAAKSNEEIYRMAPGIRGEIWR